MNYSTTAYPSRIPFRVRTVGAGGSRACNHQLPPEMSFQNRPNFRSNSTGKERDEETGYGYFGARYMDHELMNMWLSVDPMADKYPSISPYAYYNWNPIKQLDPDGMEAIECDDWYIDAKGHVQWDANVHSQDDLNNGETYLGQTVTMMAEGSDIATFGDQIGDAIEKIGSN